MSIGLDYESMYNLFFDEYLKGYKFEDVFNDTSEYLNAGFDEQSAQVCSYTDTKITAAAAMIKVIEANNAKLSKDSGVE